MKIINTFTTAIALVTGLGLLATAPPTRAETPPTMDGVYFYADEDGDTATWVIRTTCTPGCIAHVTTSPGRGFDAPLVAGRYTNTRTIPDGALCEGHLDGSHIEMLHWIPATTHPVTVTQWWDPSTLTGEVEFFNNSAPCGVGDEHDRFTLTRSHP
jgi:hypothetical protein